MIFRCFGIFPLNRTAFNFIILGCGDIVQVVRTVQIDLHKFRVAERGSNLAFALKNIPHNVYKMQKGHVVAFYKNMKDGKAIERTQLSLSTGPTVQWNSL